MKAVVYQNHGSPDILRCEEIDKPAPGDNEALVKVRAASINPLDWKVMKGGPFLVRLLLVAFRYMEAGHARGMVIITPES